MSSIRKFLKWILGFFRNQSAQPKSQKKIKKRHTKEHFGDHYYLGDLLECLDEVFADLPLLKKTDPEAFKMFSKLGASVMSSDGFFDRDIDAYAVSQLPSFGCFYCGVEPETDDKIPARFIYFFKEKRPVNVQASNQTIYRCGVTYKSITEAHSACAQFYIALSDSGTITPLKTCTPRRLKPGFVRMEWAYPERLIDLDPEEGKSPQQIATELFSIAFNTALIRERGMTVRVSKGKQSAAFAIDMLRSPYFFADREKTTTENGHTKKILHIVKGHWRTLPDGEKKFIKSHFRGLRDFMWNGYSVSIGVSGKHGRALSDFNLPAIDPLEAQQLGTRVIDSEEVADTIDRRIL